jgi:hypothetical protein
VVATSTYRKNIMSHWPAILGILVVAFTLREVYRDLFHPTATGSMSDFVASGIFKAFRHVPLFLSDAAPLAIVLVIFIWATLVCLGFALIYWTLPARDFKIDPGKPPTGFLSMVYFSFEVLTTLGLGDYTPIPLWLRLLVTFEALIGFGVLTASISSILLLHLALSRVRTFSRRVWQMIRAEEQFGFSFEKDGSEDLLLALSLDLAQTRVDLVQYPLVYYFYSTHHQAALPRVLPYALQLADAGLSPERSMDVRRAAALLRLSLQDMAAMLRERFVKVDTDECAAVFEAYLRHHLPAREQDQAHKYLTRGGATGSG